MKRYWWGITAAIASAVMVITGMNPYMVHAAKDDDTSEAIEELTKEPEASDEESGIVIRENGDVTITTICPLPERESEPEEEQYTVEDMDAVMYAVTASNIRKGPSVDYDVIAGAVEGEALTVTGRADTGWYRVVKGGFDGFISDKLLSNEPVAPKPTPEPVTPEPEPVITEPEPVIETVPEPVNPYEGMASHLWDYSEQEIINYIVATYTTPEMSPYDKAVAINNYLCATMEYDDTHSHRSTYDAIAYGIGVCQGYANAFKKLMCAAGVPTDYVAGIGYTRSGSGSHGWNRSLINGVYYYTDVTWNDGLGRNEYLLISYEQMSRDHYEQYINPYRIE